jgi:hypothetical protein
MANIENLSEQLKYVQANTNTAHHRFLNHLAQAVQRRLAEAAPELQLTYGGKQESGDVISAQLSGRTTTTDPQTLEDNVRNVMEQLSNPSNLLSALEE